MVVFGYQVGPLLKKTGREIVEDRVSTMAAQTAYYFFFSLFPLLLFLAPLLGLIVDKAVLVDFILSRVAQAAPSQVLPPIRLVLQDVVFVDDAPGLISAGALLAAWSGSNIYGALESALNAAYDVEETRPWWRRIVLRMIMLVVGGVVIAAATASLLAGEDITRWVGGLIGLDQQAIAVWSVLQFPVAFAFVALLVFLFYMLLPNVKQRKTHAVAAAAIATLLWLMATLLFRLYVQHFPPNPAYGLIGGVMILLTWMYYTMFVVLAGGELASELHNGTGAVRPASTISAGRIVTQRVSP